MKTLFFLIIPFFASAQNQCCNTYPVCTIEDNGKVTATIGDNQYALFSLNDAENIFYGRSFAFWTFQPGIHKVCATATDKDGRTCTTCLFYEVDAIDSKQVDDCINTEWIDTSGIYIFEENKVCGCDGVEYFSEWTARQNGVTKYSVGSCCFELPTSTFDTNFVKIKAFPNPTLETVRIEAFQLEQICVYDAKKRLLQTVNCYDDSTTLLLDNYAAGVYFLAITADGKTFTRKIIKQTK
jgi:hypothetical protein